jgi:hypothetical protein
MTNSIKPTDQDQAADLQRLHERVKEMLDMPVSQAGDDLPLTLEAPVTQGSPQAESDKDLPRPA